MGTEQDLLDATSFYLRKWIHEINFPGNPKGSELLFHRKPVNIFLPRKHLPVQSQQ